MKQRFGAVDVDSRIRRERWLVDALLDAEPGTGWRRSGPVLTRDAAVRALIGARLGGGELAEGNLDASSLLAWSRTSAGSAFSTLPQAEQAGLSSWLAENVGGAAVVLMSLASSGRAEDAMALGVLASAITRHEASTETALEIGRLLGPVRPRGNELPSFVDAVEGTLDRWVIEAESGTAQGQVTRQQVLDVVHQADELVAAADLVEVLASNQFLTNSFNAQLHALATALTRNRPAAADTALRAVEEHTLARLFPERARAAATAVRLTRWLAEADDGVDSVASGVRAHLMDWGWVDRGLAHLWAGDSVHDPVIGEAYRSVHDAVRARRDRLDEQFAKRLTAWEVAESCGTQRRTSGGTVRAVVRRRGSTTSSTLAGRAGCRVEGLRHAEGLRAEGTEEARDRCSDRRAQRGRWNALAHRDRRGSGTCRAKPRVPRQYAATSAERRGLPGVVLR